MNDREERIRIIEVFVDKALDAYFEKVDNQDGNNTDS